MNTIKEMKVLKQSRAPRSYFEADGRHLRLDDKDEPEEWIALAIFAFGVAWIFAALYLA